MENMHERIMQKIKDNNEIIKTADLTLKQKMAIFSTNLLLFDICTEIL